MHEAGALLVRPDGYIAWRHARPEWEEGPALLQLQDSLATVLYAHELPDT